MHADRIQLTQLPLHPWRLVFLELGDGATQQWNYNPLNKEKHNHSNTVGLNHTVQQIN